MTTPLDQKGEINPQKQFDVESARLLEEKDPRYGNGTLVTKHIAEEIDMDHLEHSTLYVAYKGHEKGDNYSAVYNMRSSFNNAEHGLGFWFLDTSAKIKIPSTKSAFSARAILNPSAYFMAAYRQQFQQGFSLKVGAETEIGKTPRHFWKFGKTFGEFKFSTMLSGEIALPKEDGQLRFVDTVSFLPRYKVSFKDPSSVVRKVRLGLVADLDVRDKKVAWKRDLKLNSTVRYRDGHAFAEVELGKSVNTELRVFHVFNPNFGLYLAYKGSLRSLDGLKTLGWQLKLPEFGKIRTSIDSTWTLRNSFIYRAHPFASIVQHTQFNAKDFSGFHMGLGLALGS